jgi:hypothetical protein
MRDIEDLMMEDNTEMVDTWAQVCGHKKAGFIAPSIARQPFATVKQKIKATPWAE